MAVDFDVLVENARMGQSKEGEHALWRAAFGLPVWFFLGVGEGEDMQPLCAVSNGLVQLLAFTDEERADAAAAARGDKEPAVVVHMDVPEAIEYCRQLDQSEQVSGVFFNNGAYGFGASLLHVIERHKRFVRGG